MEIRKLNPDEYKGKRYHTTYSSGGYYEVEFLDDHFSFLYRAFPGPRTFELTDTLLSDWLEDPSLFGVFDSDILMGLAEGSPERWNNRYRITNIFVPEENRRCGVGSLLMDQLLREAQGCGAQMAVLETQSCNEGAIAFYRKMGFEVIGCDLYAYSNEDPARHEVRIELGKKLI